MLCFFLINIVILNLLCFWILSQRASSHSCFRFFLFFKIFFYCCSQLSYRLSENLLSGKWWCSNDSKSVTTQTTQIRFRRDCLTTAYYVYTNTNKTKFVRIETDLVVCCCCCFSHGGHVQCLRACLDASLFPRVVLVLKLFTEFTEGADSDI